MIGLTPSSLDSDALARRLHDFVSGERANQVDFLLHLDEFDRREEYLPRGFGSLWEYCLRELHLREGAAGRRIAAMKALRRFPRLESPLRDGRLCLSTAPLLAQVLTEENLDDLVAQAAFKTKAEVEHLVATIQPRTAPRDGLRKLPEARAASLTLPPAGDAAPSLPPVGAAALATTASPASPAAPTAQAATAHTPAPARAPAADLHAISGNEWSLRVTIDGALKADLETLASLLSHKLRRSDLAALLREAVGCAIEKHGRRRGAVPPSRKRKSRPPLPAEDIPDRSNSIPAEVKRAVFERDGGCCAFVGKNGRRCGSRWQLEYNHVPPLAKGGKSTVEGVELDCRRHNIYEAEQVFGREYMAKYRRDRGAGTRTGKFADPGISDSQCRRPGGTGAGASPPERIGATARSSDQPGLPLPGG